MKRFIATVLLVFLLASCSMEAKVKDEQPVVNSNVASASKIQKENGNLLDWLRYPAISPDGSEIAFAFMGDIYIVPVAGGFARALTSASSFESMPVWSNDGKKIAFVSDRTGNYDIFVISRNGGTAKRVTFNSANDIPMAFSPDNSQIYFYSQRTGSKESSLFPLVLPQLYSVPTNGGTEKLELPFPVVDLKISADGSKFIYHDKKNPSENDWRKHHVSSSARDIWEYNVNTKKFNKLSDFSGEDRNPVFGENGEIYYLSEESGSFNIWKRSTSGKKTQVTKFDTHPVRFLSGSRNGTLCFSYDGQIYTLKKGGKPVKLEIFSTVERNADEEIYEMPSNVEEVAPNSNGSELAMVLRGEIYVVNTLKNWTKRITYTPNEEKWVNFHPKNRKLLYSSFRDGTWKVYEAVLDDENEPYFSTSTKISEKAVISGDFNAFQAYYSPDGKKIAYFKNRNELVVFDTEKNTHTTVLPADNNYFYKDGDRSYSWSPDSTRLAVVFHDRNRKIEEIGIVDANGGEVVNISNSGAEDSLPKWSSDGQFIVWISGEGKKKEIFAFFLNKKGLDNFRKDELEFSDEKAVIAKAAAATVPQSPDKSAAKKSGVEFDVNNIDERIVKISLYPANYVEYVLSSDNEQLFYMINDSSEFKIKKLSLRSKTENSKTENLIASIPHAVNMSTESFLMNRIGTSLFIFAAKKVNRINLSDLKSYPVNPYAEFSVDKSSGYAYLFEYVWKTMNDKFYDTGLHGVNWAKYKTEYEKHVPFINNNYDFSELLSEMLGELNVSHIGTGYKSFVSKSYTGRLGIFYSFDKNGMKIEEIIKDGPLDKVKSKVKVGNVIEKINGIDVTKESFDKLLLIRRTYKKARVSFWNPETSERWEEVVNLIDYGAENTLLYKRWVKRNKELVEKLSGGKLAYVHIRGMDESYIEPVYDEILGKYSNYEGIVIDTRFNSGGKLFHDDLAVFFSGKSYSRYSHRGTNLGGDPENRWTKKTILLVNEGNYSDAHMFPYTYRALNLGKIVGMPVAGTSTTVWKIPLPYVNFEVGIPEMGVSTNDGKYLENNELVPDFVVPMLPNDIIEGRDPQLEKAVQVLLKEK